MKSDVPIFLVWAKPDGNFKADFPDPLRSWVKSLAGETGAEAELQITLAGQNATERQKRGFHAMVKPWADKRGDPIDYLKQWILAELFGTHTYKVPGTDTFITVLAEPHTSQLTRRQYCDLIEGAMRLAAERDGIYLIAPDEYRKAKEAAAKQAEREARKRAKALEKNPEAACVDCGELHPISRLLDREREWEDGGQSGVDTVKVCRSCDSKKMRRAG